jgi:hypothetical protein
MILSRSSTISHSGSTYPGIDWSAGGCARIKPHERVQIVSHHPKPGDGDLAP